MTQRLRGRIALHVSRSGEAAPLLFDAAERLDSLEPGLARETHLEALHAAAVAGRLGIGMRDAATVARTAPAAPLPGCAADVLLDGLAVRFTDGIHAGAPTLKLALAALRDGNVDYGRTCAGHGSRVASRRTCSTTRPGICWPADTY